VNIALFASLLPALSGLLLVQAAPDFPKVRQVVVEHEVIMRVPVRPRAMRSPIDWRERAGPKCIAPTNIRGAVLSGTDHVDFVMKTGRRFRARLDSSCPGLDFYSGFYLNPQKGLLCAGRDEIRSRSGGSCPIANFHQLQPVRREASR
jgi:hypothetical protein